MMNNVLVSECKWYLSSQEGGGGRRREVRKLSRKPIKEEEKPKMEGKREKGKKGKINFR